MTTSTEPAVRGRVELAVAQGVLTVALNRPDSMNALDADMLTELGQAVQEAVAEPDVRVILIIGRGRAFCVGAELLDSSALAAKVDGIVGGANALVAALCAAPQPVVAAVRGPAAGAGISIALAADLVYASDAAYFMLAQTGIGLMPDAGATALVAASIGRARAMRMALLAEKLSASDAARTGLIADHWSDAEFDQRLADAVQLLARGPSLAYGNTKFAINAATIGALPDAFDRELTGQTSLVRTEDFHEAVTAFRERRRPKFVGR